MPAFDPHSTNAEYIENLYEQYQEDPGSLDGEWVTFFKGFEFGYWKSDQESGEL